MSRKIILIAVVLLAVTQVVSAHDTWIGKRDGKIMVLHGHGKRLDPYDPARVGEPKALDPKGNSLAVEIVKNKENASLKVKGDPAIVGALYDSGYWLKTTDGWKESTKRAGKDKYSIVQSYKSTHYCKNFLSGGDQNGKPIGQRFEVIPGKDPTTLKVGESLPIKVLLDGKPAEGAVVSYRDLYASSDKSHGKTGKDGAATVAIAAPGPQIVKAKLRIPLEGDPDADMRSFSSTIIFEAH